MNDVLDQLREKNFQRCPKFGHTVSQWTPTDWACAVAGETGEMCNLIKKRFRGDAIDIDDIGREAADVVIYVYLLCTRLGIDLKKAIVEKFNEVSIKIGSDIKLINHQS